MLGFAAKTALPTGAAHSIAWYRQMGYFPTAPHREPARSV
jgi:hypothetical protein